MSSVCEPLFLPSHLWRSGRKFWIWSCCWMSCRWLNKSIKWAACLSLVRGSLSTKIKILREVRLKLPLTLETIHVGCIFSVIYIQTTKKNSRGQSKIAKVPGFGIWGRPVRASQCMQASGCKWETLQVRRWCREQQLIGWFGTLVNIQRYAFVYIGLI